LLEAQLVERVVGEQFAIADVVAHRLKDCPMELGIVPPMSACLVNTAAVKTVPYIVFLRPTSKGNALVLSKKAEGGAALRTAAREAGRMSMAAFGPELVQLVAEGLVKVSARPNGGNYLALQISEQHAAAVVARLKAHPLVAAVGPDQRQTDVSCL
jgi:hypothetical protein